MKKLIYISFVFAFIIAFTSCEKEVITPFYNNDCEECVSDAGGTRGGEPASHGNGGGTDTNEDEEFDEEEDDTIVDPDEDEDFDEEDDKVATKPGGTCSSK